MEIHLTFVDIKTLSDQVISKGTSSIKSFGICKKESSRVDLHLYKTHTGDSSFSIQ